jgi:hypothetical protein
MRRLLSREESKAGSHGVVSAGLAQWDGQGHRYSMGFLGICDFGWLGATLFLLTEDKRRVV